MADHPPLAYRYQFKGDELLAARARLEKARERKARAKLAAKARECAVTEEKREVPVLLKPEKREDPMGKLRQGGRVPVEILVYIEDEPVRFMFSTNMMGTLVAPQRSEEALREMFGKMLKDRLG